VRLTLLCEVADGLEYLHSRTPPVVHGDMSPPNILVGDDGKACLRDFGLSNIHGPTGPAFVTTGATASLFYVAPEFTSDRGQSFQRTRSMDVYSFGCVAYELLSGERPFSNIHDGFLLIIQIHNGLSNKLQDNWWDCIQKCSSRASNERPAMSDVAKQFKTFRDESGITELNLLFPFSFPNESVSLIRMSKKLCSLAIKLSWCSVGRGF